MAAGNSPLLFSGGCYLGSTQLGHGSVTLLLFLWKQAEVANDLILSLRRLLRNQCSGHTSAVSCTDTDGGAWGPCLWQLPCSGPPAPVSHPDQLACFGQLEIRRRF